MPKYKSISKENLIRVNYDQQEPEKKKDKILDDFEDKKGVENENKIPKH